MSEQTPLERVAEAYSSADRDTMAVLQTLDEDSLKELDRTLSGISNSIELLLDE